MGRNKRIKANGNYSYHVVTRTNNREFRLNYHMKSYFQSILSHLSWLYEINVYSWTVLSNHYHICLSCSRSKDVDADKAIKRWNRYHKGRYQKNSSLEQDRSYVVESLTDISHLMKKLNTLMTREYNRRTGSEGTLWERRFRSSIVHGSRALLMTSAYIELNSFRASLVEKPEDYKHSSLYSLRKGNPGGVIATDTLGRYLQVDTTEQRDESESKRKTGQQKDKENAEKKYAKKLYQSYLRYIYSEGTRPPKRELIRGRTESKKITQQMQRHLDKRMGIATEAEGHEHTVSDEQGLEGLKKGVGLCKKIWTFTRSRFIGSRGLAKKFYTDHMDPGYIDPNRLRRHKTRWVHGMPEGSEGIWGVFNGSARGRWEQKRKTQEESGNKDETNKGRAGADPPF